MTRALGYVRLSKADVDSTSPARQRERIERLCAERGWELVQIHEDIDRSAYGGKRRPAFDRMMANLTGVDAVVFWRLDRLARSLSELLRIAKACEGAGVQLVATDGELDTSTAAGRAFFQMRGIFAELESATLSERSRQMTQYKRERGEWLGRVPYGWRRTGKGLEPDPAQVRVLREVAERYIAGESFHALAAEFDFSAGQTLRRILHADRTAQVLDPDLADRLASVLAGRKMVRVKVSAQSLLAGIATCGRCGAGLDASSRRPGRPGWLGQYRCSKGGHVGVARAWLDEFVSEAVIDAIDTGRLVEAIRTRQQRGQTRKTSDLEARLTILEDEFADGRMRPERFRELRGRLIDVLEEARQTEHANGFILPEGLARDLVNRWGDLSVPERRQIIRAVLERVEIAPFDGIRKGRPRAGVDPDRVRLVWRA